MIPQFEYTKDSKEAWYPSVQVAEGVAQFCNWYWRQHGESQNFFADIMEIDNETSPRAAVRVIFHDNFVTYIKHPIKF